jgi:hypothetical protein
MQYGLRVQLVIYENIKIIFCLSHIIYLILFFVSFFSDSFFRLFIILCFFLLLYMKILKLLFRIFKFAYFSKFVLILKCVPI